MAHSITNSKITGVKNPNVNLSPLSMDLKALLIAKTVFLELILWKYKSRACKCSKDLIEVFLITL